MEEEIDLVGYIRIIFKRKWTILGCVFVFIVLGLIFNLQSQKKYNAETILKVGQFEINQTKEFLADSPSELVEKIKNRNYNEEIKSKMNLRALPEIKAENPKDTKLVIIKTVWQDSLQAIKILEELDRLILEEHQKKFDIQKNILLDSQKRLENKISFLENEKKILEDKIGYLAELASKDPSTGNQVFLTEAKESLEKKKSEIEKEYLNLNSLRQKIENSETTYIIKKASVNEGAENVYITLVLAAVLGLIIGFFLAFFQEFFERNKSKLLG